MNATPPPSSLVAIATLARAADLVGRPVVSIVDGTDIAEIKDVVFEPDRHALMGFTLNKRGFWRGSLKQLLAANHVHAIGSDAVMVADDTALSEKGDGPAELHRHAERVDVLGLPVMTTGGRQLGTIAGVILSLGEHCDVVGYEILDSNAPKGTTPTLVPIDAQVALSSDALLLPEEIEQYVRHDLVGFGAAVDSYRARTAPVSSIPVAPLVPSVPPPDPAAWAPPNPASSLAAPPPPGTENIDRTGKTDRYGA